LAPNLVTLNDLERQNRGFYGFFGDFGLRHKSMSFTRWCHTTRYAMADVYIYMAVNKMSNLIDFMHLQIVLLSVAYSKIKTFSSIAGIMTTKF